MIRGVILDVDGTLVDSNDAHVHAWLRAMAEHGYEPGFEKVRRLVGMGGDNLMPAAIGLDKDSPEGKPIGERRAEFFRRDYLPNLRPFPRVKELVQRMRDEGLKIVVATSAKQDEAQPLLELAGVADLIEGKTTADQAKNSKPDPDSVAAALESLGLPATEVVMIGDTPYDIEAAGKVGVPVIAVRCGGFSDQDLAGAIAIYDEPADLLARYDQSPLAGGVSEPQVPGTSEREVPGTSESAGHLPSRGVSQLAR